MALAGFIAIPMHRNFVLVNLIGGVVSRYHNMEVAMSDSAKNDNGGHDGPNKDKMFVIKIDRTEYKVHQEILTGAELRQLSNPEIGPDRDLFEVVPGGSDIKIEASTQVPMRHGLRFFTAPAQINPGQH